MEVCTSAHAAESYAFVGLGARCSLSRLVKGGFWGAISPCPVDRHPQGHGVLTAFPLCSMAEILCLSLRRHQSFWIRSLNIYH